MRTWIKTLYIVGALLLALLAVGTTYLFTTDLGRHRVWIESLVASRTGRDFAIEGEFHVELGRIVHVYAEHIRLANPGWAQHKTALELNKLDVRLHLWSLLRAPIRVSALSLGGARINLERRADGRRSWALDNGAGGRAEPSGSGEIPTGLPVLIENLDARDIAINVIAPRMEKPLDIVVDALHVTEDADRRLSLALNGKLADHPIDAKGHLGPLQAMFSRDVKLGFDLETHLGLGDLTLRGDILSPTDFEQANVELTISGSSLQAVTRTFGLAPIGHGAYTAGATLRGDRQRLAARLRVNARDLAVTLDGSSTDPFESPSLDMTVQANGPSLGGVLALAGVSLPAQPFDLSGHLQHDATSTRFDNIRFNSDGMGARIDGRLGIAPDYDGTALEVQAKGPDLFAYRTLLGLERLQPKRAAAFDVSLRLTHRDQGLALESASLTVDGNTVRADGRLGQLPYLEGAELRLNLDLPNAAALGTLLGVGQLPTLRLTGDGRIGVTRQRITLQSVRLAGRPAELSVDGIVVRRPRAAGSRIDVTLKGDDLAQLGTAFDVDALPVLPFNSHAQLRLTTDAILLQRLNAELGTSRWNGDGELRLANSYSGSQLQLNANGPDLGVLFRTHTDGQKTPLAFDFDTEWVWQGHRATIRRLRLDAGDATLSVDGDLGALPGLAGTDLDLHLQGDDLAVIARAFTDITAAHDTFELTARATGSDQRIAVQPVRVRVGPHQANGSVIIERGDPVRFQLHMDADTITLARQTPSAAAPAASPPPRPPIARQRLIPNEQLPTRWLEHLTGDIGIDVRRLHLYGLEFDDLHVDGQLRPGELQIQPLRGGLSGGRFEGQVTIRTVKDGMRVGVQLQAADVRLGVLGNDRIPIEQSPPIDLGMTLHGHGRSLHDIASSTTGRTHVVLGRGRLRNIGSIFYTSDLVLQIVRALNPFSEQNTTTNLQCGLGIFTANSGIVSIDPLLAQSDKLLFVSRGTVNLADESLNVEFRSTPREGLGLSAGTLFNPYLKVGGTLANPQLTLDPKSAALSGGAAAATSGLSIIGKALWDRLTAGEAVCQKELKRRGLRLPGTGSNTRP